MDSVEDRWFNTPDSNTLCRGGGNGPQHPSQMYAINKYVKAGMTFLDYGCGSGTTLEALLNSNFGRLNHTSFSKDLTLTYKGLDLIPKNIEWCRKNFEKVDVEFGVNPTPHKIDEPDKSWDVVYSRHVVDHMESFEKALDEHCRVAKKLVIVVLWVPPGEMEEHQIKNIIDQGKVYEDEYTNQYSKPLMMKYFNEKEKDGWKLLEYATEVGSEVRGHDVVIVLQHE